MDMVLKIHGLIGFNVCYTGGSIIFVTGVITDLNINIWIPNPDIVRSIGQNLLVILLIFSKCTYSIKYFNI